MRIAANEIVFAKQGFQYSVRPLLMTKSTINFEFERKHSQRTGSVAKIAGGLELVQPIAEDD